MLHYVHNSLTYNSQKLKRTQMPLNRGMDTGNVGFILILFLAYYLIPKKYQWMLLLAASYFFYFMAGAYCLIYILVTTVTVYLLGRRIEDLRKEQSDYLKEHREKLGKEEKKAYKDGMKRRQWRTLLVGLFVNLGILAVVK